MRKTLLIAAAALAASAITSQAQVYSQNIVGYVNIPETANGFSLEAPALDMDGTGTNNTLASLFPAPALGDNLYLYSASAGQYQLYQYTHKAINHVQTTNWFDPNGNVASTFKINPGQSYFYNAAVAETNTYVGVVLQGTLTNPNVPVAGGFALVSSQVPLAGGLTSTLGYVPTLGDNVYLYQGGAYALYQYTHKAINHVQTTNWFDPNGNVNEPQIAVGQGFWLNPVGTTTWTEVFTAQ